MMMQKAVKTVRKKSWEEFRKVGLLWWINRILHLFGWAIVFDMTPKGKVLNVYPARVTFRGFHEKDEDAGFRNLSGYLKDHADDLQKEFK
jgi:hypothetical protein